MVIQNVALRHFKILPVKFAFLYISQMMALSTPWLLVFEKNSKHVTFHRYVNNVPIGTQFYLPSGRGNVPILTPAKAGTRFIDHRGKTAPVGVSSLFPVYHANVMSMIVADSSAACR